MEVLNLLINGIVTLVGLLLIALPYIIVAIWGLLLLSMVSRIDDVLILILKELRDSKKEE